MKNLKIQQGSYLLLVVCISSMFFFLSCKKETNENGAKLSDDQIDLCVDGATVISTNVQSFVFDAMSEAVDNGFYPGDIPSPETKKSTRLPGNQPQSTDYSWHGPDGNGWYYRSYAYGYGYDYSEWVKYGDTIAYESRISSSGSEGSFSYTTTTRYFKHVDQDVVKYDGYSMWVQKTSGYQNTSEVDWKITFEDWNPLTNAGTYDWYWGVPINSGGDVVPLFRYEHLVATEKTTELLHIHATWYDDNGDDTWDFEYDTPFSPVEMPVIPDLNGK